MAWVALVLASIAQQTVALHFEAVEAKEHPVSRVVKLLQDMKGQLEKEADADEEVYSKMACWCSTNDKGKTKSISDAGARIANLENTIEKMTSLSATLNGEISGLNKEFAQLEVSGGRHDPSGQTAC